MKLTNPRIALYKQAMALEDRRATLQRQLDEVSSKLTTVNAQLFGQEVKATVTRVSNRLMSQGRAARGTLKTQILEALDAAGKAGLQVKDLAATLGAKLPNIHAWFQSSGKRIPSLKKIGRGHYRLEGTIDPLINPAKSVTKTSSAPKRGKRRGKRGALSASILAALKEAGSQGAKIKDLSKQLGIPSKNLFIWFSSTGKKNRSIKKVDEAHYKLND